MPNPQLMPYPRTDERRWRSEREGSVPFTLGYVSTLPLAGREEPAAAARHHTRGVLTAWRLPAEVVDNAMLIVSELAANAERDAAGAGGPTQVSVAMRDLDVVIAVTDHDGQPLVCPPAAGGDAESGRGLDIVDMLSLGHGCVFALGRKTVWAQLGLPQGVRPAVR
jgi:hypothetical protein